MQVYGVSFHPSGNYFGTVSADLTLKMWRSTKAEHEGDDGHASLIASFATLHTDRIRNLAYSFGNCVTVSEDGSVCVTTVEKCDLFRLVKFAFHGIPNCLIFGHYKKQKS
jgi:WD40 repeat protein